LLIFEDLAERQLNREKLRSKSPKVEH